MATALNFLVIDDDPADAGALQGVLRRENALYSTEAASSLQDGKRKLRSGRFDLVILDLDLPDSRGIDSVIDLQATVPEIPIVVVTGNADEQVALRAMGIGAEDYIRKERLDQGSLATAARFAIERHRRKRQLYQDIDGMRLSLDDAMLQAQTDALTGLPNRRGLQRHLERISHGAISSEPLIVGLADLDHFKAINDLHGHDVGDLILLEFVARLQACLGHEDFAARVGGDEFVIVMGEPGRAAAEAAGTRLITRLGEGPAVVGGQTIPFSASVAMAELIPPFVDLEQILKQNHAMMAAAKDAGRARVRYSWNPEGLEIFLGDRPGEDLRLGERRGAEASEGDLLQYLRPLHSLLEDEVLGAHLSYALGAEAHGPKAAAFSRARIAGKLGHLTLEMARHAARYRQSVLKPARDGRIAALHLDIDAEALKPWMVGELISIFPEGRERGATCLFFKTDFVTKVGADVLMPVRLLKKAGFEIGIRGLGEGITVLEHLIMMEPDWIRLDSKLTANVSRFPEKARRLERLIGALCLLEATPMAEEMTGHEDMRVLGDMGCAAAYGPLQRLSLDALAA